MISKSNRNALSRVACGIAATVVTVSLGFAGSAVAATPDAVASAGITSTHAIAPATTTHIAHLVVTSRYDTATPVGVVPAGTASLTFTATATNDPVAPATAPVPVVAAVVTFTIVDSSAPAVARTVTISKGTGFDGTTSIVGTPEARTAGTIVEVSATAGDATSGPPDTVTYADRSAAAGKLTVSPSTLTVSKGGVVSTTAKVVDQFGDGISGQSLLYTVSGRNDGKSGTAKTTIGGTVAITYTDAGINPELTSDSIAVVAATAGVLDTATATVSYLAESAAPATVTIGQPTTQSALALGATTTHGVSATVRNSNDELLANQAVTFTVDKGFVSGAPAVNTAATSYLTVTDASGVATAAVGSKTSGTQTILVSAGSVSSAATKTYLVGAAFAVILAPGDTTFAPGSSKNFTATVVDQFGNPVSGAAVSVTSDGPGSLGSTVSAPTDVTGSVSATLTTTAAERGDGAVTATSAVSGAGSIGAATSTYTVESPLAAMSISVTGRSVFDAITVQARVLRADRTAASNEIVNFSVTGANPVLGSAPTDSAGIATLTYTADNAGRDRIAVTVGTLTARATASIAKLSERPKLYVDSPIKGQLSVVVNTHPVLAGASVHLYKFVNGTRRYFGKTTTDNNGHASITFKGKKSSTVYTFQARVVTDNKHYLQHYSHTNRQKVS